MRIGDIRIRQLSRQRRAAVEAGEDQAAAELAERQLRLELQEWAERAANYPTDLTIKFELGRRQLAVGDLDGAIPSFQAAQRDPRRHVQALTLMGQAFARKGWYPQAAKTFAKALEEELPEDRLKELRYNLGDVQEKMGDLAAAQEQYSTVAMIDYNYKDVRQRLEAVRKRLAEKSGQ
jgi:tetratricopeptide (TPR) repeat protein